MVELLLTCNSQHYGVHMQHISSCLFKKDSKAAKQTAFTVSLSTAYQVLAGVHVLCPRQYLYSSLESLGAPVLTHCIQIVTFRAVA